MAPKKQTALHAFDSSETPHPSSSQQKSEQKKRITGTDRLHWNRPPQGNKPMPWMVKRHVPVYTELIVQVHCGRPAGLSGGLLEFDFTFFFFKLGLDSTAPKDKVTSCS